MFNRISGQQPSRREHGGNDRPALVKPSVYSPRHDPILPMLNDPYQHISRPGQMMSSAEVFSRPGQTVPMVDHAQVSRPGQTMCFVDRFSRPGHASPMVDRVDRPSDYPSSTGQTMPSNLDTSAPASILTTPEDIQMASRQQHIKSMTGPELAAQEKWVQSYIARQRVCPANYGWKPVNIFCGGYRCEGDNHIITHKIIAEGMGGVYVWRGHEIAFGPYYPDAWRPDYLVYGGPLQMDNRAPPYIMRCGQFGRHGLVKSSGQKQFGQSRKQPILDQRLVERLRNMRLPTATSLAREGNHGMESSTQSRQLASLASHRR
ncbi:hypothetical protein G7Y89_g2294 [Cudoniella acicularis]|uniref:Uncharacterized protein n=1 Tax=Cudoniella acicularis TaxID=354080 RepID=A0A8H4W747_9HELO|nr:hypothetical protein G7Y89_g2294 [Cudoniella acicularis]